MISNVSIIIMYAMLIYCQTGFIFDEINISYWQSGE